MKKRMILKDYNGKKFYSIFLSYLVIFLIVFAVMAIGYVRAFFIFETQNRQSDEMLFEQMRLAFDTQLNYVNELTTSLQMDPYLSDFLSGKEKIDADDAYALLQMKNYLSSKYINSEIANGFYLCFDNEELVLSPNAVYSYSLLHEITFDQTRLPYPEFIGTLKGRHIGNYANMAVAPRGDGVVYFQTLSQDEENINLMVLLNTKSFESTIDNMEKLNQGTIFIIEDISGEMVYQRSNAQTMPDIDEVVQNSISADGNDAYIVLHKQSEVAGLTYYFLPPTVYSKTAINFALFVVLSCIAALGCALAFALYFTRWNYAPIKAMIRKLSQHTGNAFDRAVDEYNYINQNLTDIFEKQNQLSKNQKEMINILLNKVLKGGNTGEVCQRLAEYDVHFETEEFFVGIFYFDSVGNLFFEDSGENMELLQISKFILENVFLEVISPICKCYMTDWGDLTACVINRKQGHVLDAEQIIRCCKEAVDVIQAHYGLKIGAVFSDEIIGVYNIAESFDRCMVRIEKMMFTETHDVQISGVSAESKNKNAVKFHQLREQFLNCVDVGDFSNAKTVIFKMLDESFMTKDVNPAVARMRIANVVDEAISAVYEEHYFPDGESWSNGELYQALAECHNLSAMQTMISEALNQCAALLENKKKKDTDIIENQIVHYIQENSHNPNISVGMIAQLYDMNDYELSKFFKKCTGERMIEYIHKVRINHAKQLLLETDLKIKEIAEKVGYYDSDSLIRNFKKVTGITPGQFRQQNND